MSLYLDTSCLLKLFLPEPETHRVLAIVSAESRVLVSTLTRLEALVQLQGRVRGGFLDRRLARRLVARMEATLALVPYELAVTPLGIDATAERQIQPFDRRAHCRTLDRLHLASMELLGVRRLLTNDRTQAAAAQDLGFEVILPR